jgi:hypothetical protein
MPPQQSDRLLDVFDDPVNFRAHGWSGKGSHHGRHDADVAIALRGCNRLLTGFPRAGRRAKRFGSWTMP